MTAVLNMKPVPATREEFPARPASLLSCDKDFAPELHRARSIQAMTRLFGETMSKKTSNTADAKQKRE